MDPRAFAEPRRAASIGADDLHVIGRALMATLDAPRRKFGPAEGRSQVHALLADDPVLANQAKAAAELARTCIDRIQRVLLDDDPVLLLGDFGRDDVRLTITHAHET